MRVRSHYVSIGVLYIQKKGIPRQAEVAQGVPGRLRPRIISTFGTTRVVGCQPYAPAAFTPGEIPGTHFQRLSRPQGTWFCRKEPRKKFQVTPPGIDPRTVRLVAQHHTIMQFEFHKRWGTFSKGEKGQLLKQDCVIGSYYLCVTVR